MFGESSESDCGSDSAELESSGDEDNPNRKKKRSSGSFKKRSLKISIEECRQRLYGLKKNSKGYVQAEARSLEEDRRQAAKEKAKLLAQGKPEVELEAEILEQMHMLGIPRTYLDIYDNEEELYLAQELEWNINHVSRQGTIQDSSAANRIVWISKRCLLNRGEGLELRLSVEDCLKVRDQIPAHSSTVIQQYVKKPHLFRGKKYGIRQWVVVTSFGRPEGSSSVGQQIVKSADEKPHSKTGVEDDTSVIISSVVRFCQLMAV